MIRNSTSETPDALTNHLPLKRIRHPTHVLYVSAIAHRIAPQYGVSTAEIATEIAQAINQQPTDCWNQMVEDDRSIPLWSGITVQVTTADDLLFQVHDRAIAAWLNHLVWQPLSPPSASPSSSLTLTPFPLQHAHARCCALLCLADRTQLITLQQPDADPLTWQWLEPHPIPWLTPTAQLYPEQLAERYLINQLCVVLDEWSERSLTSKIAVQQVERLVQGFHDAHRAYPIWGDRSPEARARQAAHLGLLLVTQRVVRCLLDALGIPAPTEL